jgi:hypothetical protein
MGSPSSKFIFNNVSKEGENLRRIQKRKKERIRRGENNKFHPQYLKSEVYGSNMLRFHTYFSITLSSTNIREKRWSWNMYRYKYGLLPALFSQSCNIHIYISMCRNKPMWAMSSLFSGLQILLVDMTLFRQGKPLPTQNTHTQKQEYSCATSDSVTTKPQRSNGRTQYRISNARQSCNTLAYVTGQYS